jgi:hypothetical protein
MNCPVCDDEVREEVFHEDNARVHQWHCLTCGWRDYVDDTPYDSDPDIQAFNLLEAAGLIPEPPDAKALVLRMQRRFKLRMLESPLNKQRFYFRQELVNGLFED